MKNKKNFYFLKYSKSIDAILSVLIVPAAYLLLLFRRLGAKPLPKTSAHLKKIGVYPIRDHYSEPLFNDAYLLRPLGEDRELPGINLAVEEQINFLSKLQFSEELRQMKLDAPAKSDFDFCIQNGSFGSGDSEFLYQFIRYVKPKKVIEIGSGNSTKIVRLALKRNEAESGAAAEHVCIEPYEQPWLRDLTGITLIRERVEKLNYDWGRELQSGDLLFVDSSHMIRPQGDVVTEYLNIFPRLGCGVFVHIHDIFTPKDYPEAWLKDDVIFWNEQYLLEALLTNTNKYEITASLNYLKHHHYDNLVKVCPYLTREREPGSFYLRVLD
jgi:hypothetical protein